MFELARHLVDLRCDFFVQFDDTISLQQSTFPPVYWINLDASVSRRKTILKKFEAFEITNTHRVSAYNTSAINRIWKTGQLVLHPRIHVRLEESSQQQKHEQNIYQVAEAACILSHLKAIKQAYDDGHDQVLVIEDDVLMSCQFVNLWRQHVDQAPMGWKILQFVTNNPCVAEHGHDLFDPFISWQPHHWSTGAYMINRAGMQTLLDKVKPASLPGEDVWRIDQEPIVVADEVLYHVWRIDQEPMLWQMKFCTTSLVMLTPQLG